MNHMAFSAYLEASKVHVLIIGIKAEGGGIDSALKSTLKIAHNNDSFEFVFFFKFPQLWFLWVGEKLSTFG